MRPPKPSNCFHYKKKLRSLFSIAKMAGFSYSLLYNRIHRDGMTLYEAMNHSTSSERITVVYKGKCILLCKLAKQFNMKCNTVKSRLKKGKMSLYEALTTPLKGANPEAEKEKRTQQSEEYVRTHRVYINSQRKENNMKYQLAKRLDIPHELLPAELLLIQRACIDIRKECYEQRRGETSRRAG